MKSLSLAVCSAILLLTSPALADDRASYTGKWGLDKKASEIEDPPAYIELNLQMNGDDLEVKRRVIQKNGKVDKGEYTYVPNGQAQTIKVGEDSDRSAVSSWDGTTLKIVSTMTQMGTEFTVDTEWRLKGKDRLEIENKLNHPLRKSEWTEVFVRKDK